MEEAFQKFSEQSGMYALHLIEKNASKADVVRL